jgi:hypothetical protein
VTEERLGRYASIEWGKPLLRGQPEASTAFPRNDSYHATALIL